jgi:endoglucanase
MQSMGIALRALVLCALSGAVLPTHAASQWPDWDRFVTRFIQADGRVIDLTFDRKTTSEGQSYALFFALVANQRAQFDTLLKWTSDNLAAGQLGSKLPAWHWGLRDDGSWAVKDPNSASDADLWMAYSLLEAARLWKAPEYADTGRKLLAQIRLHETAEAGAAGPVLLPGAFGFALDKGRYRLNPSYVPGFMFRYLAVADPQGPWQKIWEGYLRMAPQIFPAGIAPDLFTVDSSGKVMPDSEREPSGSYDAIRVYLWAGLSGEGSRDLVRSLNPYAILTHSLGAPPEKVNPLTGAANPSSYSPIGFSGAVLPFLSASGDKVALDKQRERVESALRRTNPVEPTHYYDQVLILFGKGWIDGQYQFDREGRVHVRWQ